MLACEHNSFQIIKFAVPGESNVVTSVDKGILELKTAVGNMFAQIETIQHRID